MVVCAVHSAEGFGLDGRYLASKIRLPDSLNSSLPNAVSLLTKGARLTWSSVESTGKRKKQDMSGQESRLTMNGSALSPAEVPGATPARPTVDTLLVLPATAAAHTSSAEPPTAHTQSPSELRNQVAQALHETVLQTLVATTYLAESPETSRQDLVDCLRQATNELNCFIDGLAISETPSTWPAPMGISPNLPPRDAIAL